MQARPRGSAEPLTAMAGSERVDNLPEPRTTPARRGRSGWTLLPDPEVVALSLRWAAALTALFAAIYGSLNWLTAQREHRLQLWFDWELAIPLVPWMVWPYLSLVASFFLPMFALDATRIRALCRRLAFATVVSGLAFLLFPAELGFVRADPVAGHDAAFRFIHALDLPHNLAPSLHVSFSLVLLLTLRSASPSWLRAGFDVWLALLIASVLFTHQHHVLDVAGGMLVALAARAAVRPDGRWSINLPRRAR